VGKYDQFIRDFLLKNGNLSVEKIGKFNLSRFEADEKTIQSQFIEFTFNKKEQTSEELVDFIAKETSKNKTLISADISYFFEEARQYINIGKPFLFAGLGKLVLSKSGEYEFKPLQGTVTVEQSAAGSPAGRQGKAPVTKKLQRRNVVMVFALTIIILITAGAGWGVYKYLGQKKAGAVLTTPNQPDTDTTVATAQSKPPATDSTFFRFVFENTANKYRARNRYDSLRSWGEHVFIDSTGTDSNKTYHLFIKAKILPRDTSYVRDSIQKYFQRPVTVAAN
jgi:hypothetical protein